MSTSNSLKRAAVSLVEREGRILCVWNLRYETWTMPGGRVEEGETVEEAQARELFEETGLRTIDRVRIFEGPHGIAVPSTRGSTICLFRVDAAGQPAQGEDGSPIRWMTHEEFFSESRFGPFYEKILARDYVPRKRPIEAIRAEEAAFLARRSLKDLPEFLRVPYELGYGLGIVLVGKNVVRILRQYSEVLAGPGCWIVHDPNCIPDRQHDSIQVLSDEEFKRCFEPRGEVTP